MNARTPSSMLLPVETAKSTMQPATALPKDEELHNFMVLSSMGQLRVDQLFYMADKLQSEQKHKETI